MPAVFHLDTAAFFLPNMSANFVPLPATLQARSSASSAVIVSSSVSGNDTTKYRKTIRQSRYKPASPYIFWMEFGDRLREARQGKELSQEQLGEKLGKVAKQAISHWENGHHFPSIQQLVQIAAILNVSFDWLLLGKSPENLSIGAIQQAKLYESLDTANRRKWEGLRKAFEIATGDTSAKKVTADKPPLQVVPTDTRLTQSDTGSGLREEVATRTKARQRVKRVSTQEQEGKNGSGRDDSQAAS